MTSTNTHNVYSYDKLGRLSSVGFSNGASITYHYDEVGNRTSTHAVPAIAQAGPTLPSNAFGKKMNGDFKNNGMLVKISSNELTGWGDNTQAMLANGINAATNSLPQSPLFDPGTVPPPANATIVDWTFTNANLYVVYSNGWVYSCGQNDYGQTGHGDATTVVRANLKRIEYFFNAGIMVTKVWAGGGATTATGGGCVYFQDSTYKMYGCGLNTTGNLGINSTTNISVPQQCNGFTPSASSFVVDVQVIIVGTTAPLVSTFMLLSDNTMAVAGHNAYGQLGVNNLLNVTAAFTSPVNASNLSISNVASISANGSGNAINALYVDKSGAVFATGYNGHGECGANSPTNQKIFTAIPGLASVVVASAGLGGGFYGSGYALDTSGKLYTWGYNGQSNLFRGNATTPQVAAVVPSANLPFQNIASVFFGKGGGGTTATCQMILVSTTGAIAYAGNDNGLAPVAILGTIFNQLPLQLDLVNGLTIVDVFVHGTAQTQRLFVLTSDGSLFAIGNNADGICTGGRLVVATATVTTCWNLVPLS